MLAVTIIKVGAKNQYGDLPDNTQDFPVPDFTVALIDEAICYALIVQRQLLTHHHADARTTRKPPQYCRV